MKNSEAVARKQSGLKGALRGHQQMQCSTTEWPLCTSPSGWNPPATARVSSLEAARLEGRCRDPTLHRNALTPVFTLRMATQLLVGSCSVGWSAVWDGHSVGRSAVVSSLHSPGRVPCACLWCLKSRKLPVGVGVGITGQTQWSVGASVREAVGVGGASALREFLRLRWTCRTVCPP